MDGWGEGKILVWMDGCMDGWMEGQMEGQMEGGGKRERLMD